ncbi:oxidoreductase [Bordetella sp. J329]|uniref:PDR/VanB family oxidoreductase n=1 Tax=Kerstersia gyiorum TaxID=206506 RepID=UPI000FDC5A6B|nr:PDR/VanB family oxidoreductase [Kerstersia gyiorum]AZV95513.1 oxidoreductase [Bordetella sp. J329]MCR4158922.1 PDR/VanB family oxidoreductase [Kerstersia gyiorum]
MEILDLVVSDTRQLTPLVRQITLRSVDGAALPAAQAGAHLKIAIPGLDEPRCYSLVLAGEESCTDDGPQQAYCLGVRLESDSSGGSRFMHALKMGDRVQASVPRNDFPLQEHAGQAVLIAGGIGITPILSMAVALRCAGRPFQAHYCASSREHMAFLPELQAVAGDGLALHPADEPGGRLDLSQLMASVPRDSHLYVCGPRRMLDALLEHGKELAWPACQLHFELFETATPQEGDQAFEIELRQSGMVLQVPADRTIADVLEEAGCDPMYDCKRGECGVCSVDVLDGTPDHRDYFLSDSEKAAGKVIQICISRSKSPRLVLDL